MKQFKIVVIIVFAVIGTILVLQNAADVTMRFLFWSVTMSQALLLLIVAAIGFIIGLVVAFLARSSSR